MLVVSRLYHHCGVLPSGLLQGEDRKVQETAVGVLAVILVTYMPRSQFAGVQAASQIFSSHTQGGSMNVGKYKSLFQLVLGSSAEAL